MNPVRIAARSLLATIFLTSGVDVLRRPQPRAEAAKPVITQIRSVVPALPDDDVAVVRLNAAVQLVGGSLLLLGKFQRLSALVLAGSLVPTTWGGHRFWEHDDPASRRAQQVHFEKNLAILGGLLFAALDRKGRPSLGYRARKAGRRAAKTAKRTTG